MHVDQLHERLGFLLLWISANTLGCALGWSAGEWVGQEIFQRFGWTAGHWTAWLTFESLVWLPRWSVLALFPVVGLWKRLDTLIWVSAELIGWSLGAGFYQLRDDLSTPVWTTAGSVIGFVLAATVWIPIAAMRRVRPGRWWFLRATLAALGGFILGNIVFVLGMRFNINPIDRATAPLVNQFLSGAPLGALVGLITGVIIAWVWTLPAPQRMRR